MALVLIKSNRKSRRLPCFDQKDIDLKEFFGSVRHHTLLSKMAERINDNQILHLAILILKSNAESGIVQGSPLSPLLNNIDLNGVDAMLERAKQYTHAKGASTDCGSDAEGSRYDDAKTIAIGPRIGDK